ncbi:MAG TPA: molybdenum cofactor guanylyltransferase [Candidatus Bariatricus faecipullorum]|nr:molybdenum cofactor guanylyltransferase [Candidatus Bariatricus faecipullorum]
MEIAGYILAGGKNRRMQGEKKLFLPWDGATFLERIQETLCAFPAVYLSVEAVEPYQGLSLPLVLDVYPDAGPLGGICAGLGACPEDALFVTACDMPLLDRESVERLCLAFRERPVLTLPETDSGLQPLPGIYPRSILPEAERLLKEKQYRLRALAERVEVNRVRLEETPLKNVNTPEEYRELLKSGQKNHTGRGKEECFR